MPVKYTKKHASLEEIVTVEDAEALQEWLKKHPTLAVNVSKCTNLHAAVLQVLLGLRPALTGECRDPWLNQALAGLR